MNRAEEFKNESDLVNKLEKYIADEFGVIHIVIDVADLPKVLEAYAKSQEGGWISVEDDLPPEGTKRYLIIRDGEVSMDTWITRDGKSFWYNYLGLTHWTTLPEPPKTKDNN